MHRGQMDIAKKWTSTIEFLKLKKPLRVRIEQGINAVNVFEPKLHICGSGGTLAEAVDMFFDHLMLDYCDYDVAPGALSADDKLYGRHLRELFHRRPPERADRRLLDFHG